MTYTPYYLAEATARLFLGNTATQNIHADMDEAAMRYADSSINSKIGGQIPTNSIHFGKAVGIAYLLYKVTRQNGTETEKQRKLDYDIATADLVTLEQDMIATGEIPSAAGGGSGRLDDLGPGAEYETDPLNPQGNIVFGAKTRRGVTTSKRRELDVLNPNQSWIV